MEIRVDGIYFTSSLLWGGISQFRIYLKYLNNEKEKAKCVEWFLSSYLVDDPLVDPILLNKLSHHNSLT